MPKMQISRSVEIDAPIEKIYSSLTNFKEWPNWSPWLIAEPGCKISYAEDGKSYEWEGQRIGSGNMEITDTAPNHMIDYNLVFLKPWKSKAKVKFLLEEKDNGVNVTWTMDSSLPFFMFFMKKMMEAYVGADYERGLEMLKPYLETGEVPSKLEFSGESVFEGCDYIGIKTDCAIETIGTQMESDYTKLRQAADQEGWELAGPPFSIYHKWDIVNGKVNYTACMPLKSVTSVPEGFVSGSIPKTKVNTVRHVGSYYHVGNGWSTQMMMARNKEFKHNKKIDPFEVYLNNPADTAPKDLITEIHFPVKG